MSSYKNLNKLSVLELMNEIPEENMEKMICNAVIFHNLEVYYKYKNNKCKNKNYEVLKTKYLLFFNSIRSKEINFKKLNYYGLAFDNWKPVIVDYDMEEDTTYAVETDYKVEELSIEELLALKAICCTDKYKPIDYLSMCLAYLYGREEDLNLKREVLNRMLELS